MKPSFLWRVLFLLIASFFCSHSVFAQGSALSKTDLGKSQNTTEDLYNSLVPGPQHYGKNEKKAEVDPKTLQSKKSNDTTFSGGMNDIGLDWHSEKMGKPPGKSNASFNSSKQSDAAVGEKTGSKAAATTGDKKSSDASHEKTSEKSTFDLESTNLQLSSLESDTDTGASKSDAKAQTSPTNDQKAASAKSDKQPEKEKSSDPGENH
jgi:hypothetical protein